MKITEVTKSMTYYVDTDAEDFPYYRTNETGRHWENLMGDSWEPVYNPDTEKELKELFLDWRKKEYEGRDDYMKDKKVETK
jgi:hypothetical protein